MTDTVKLVLEQIDDQTGEAISRVVAEWYKSDRDTANAMSISLTKGVVESVAHMGAAKAKYGAEGVAAAVFGEGEKIPPGAIR